MPDAGDRRALIIAIGEYLDPRFQSLSGPKHDAEQLERVLGDPAIGRFTVDKSIDKGLLEIREKLSDLFGSAHFNDFLLVHFACHGLTDDAEQFYLAAHDTRKDKLRATALEGEWLLREMEASRARRIVLLLDCCESGSFPMGLRARGDDDGAERLNQAAVHVARNIGGRGRVVITAASALGRAWEGDQRGGGDQSSVFTRVLVQGLATGEADRDGRGEITVDELYDYVYDRVRAIVPEQRPQKVGSAEGALVFAWNPHQSLRPGPPPAPDVDRLEPLYRAGMAALLSQNWRLAIRKFTTVQQVDAGYRDVAEQLLKARTQQRRATNYQKLRQLASSKRWQDVINLVAQLAAADPGFVDHDNLLPMAQTTLSEQEIKRLYDQAKADSTARKWLRAERALNRVLELQPKHRPAAALLKKVVAARKGVKRPRISVTSPQPPAPPVAISFSDRLKGLQLPQTARWLSEMNRNHLRDIPVVPRSANAARGAAVQFAAEQAAAASGRLWALTLRGPDTRAKRVEAMTGYLRFLTRVTKERYVIFGVQAPSDKVGRFILYVLVEGGYPLYGEAGVVRSGRLFSDSSLVTRMQATGFRPSGDELPYFRCETNFGERGSIDIAAAARLADQVLVAGLGADPTYRLVVKQTGS